MIALSIGLMMTSVPSLPSGHTSIDEAISAALNDHYVDESVDDRWPIWLRLVVIIGLSALLWSGIIWAILKLIG